MIGESAAKKIDSKYPAPSPAPIASTSVYASQFDQSDNGARIGL